MQNGSKSNIAQHGPIGSKITDPGVFTFWDLVVFSGVDFLVLVQSSIVVLCVVVCILYSHYTIVFSGAGCSCAFYSFV